MGALVRLRSALGLIRSIIGTRRVTSDPALGVEWGAGAYKVGSEVVLPLILLLTNYILSQVR